MNDTPTLTRYEREAMFAIPPGDGEPLPSVRRNPVEIIDATVFELDPVTLEAVTMRPVVPEIVVLAA